MNRARSTRIFWALPVAAGVLAAAACVAPWTPLRIALAIPPTLLLTGYALMRAVSGPVQLDLHLRVALSLGLSLVTLILGAMILNFVGIYAATWAVLLTAVTALGSFIAWRRGATGPELRRPRLPRVSGPTIVVASVALALAVAAVVFSRTLLPAPNAIGYTELSIRPTVESGAPAVRVWVSCQQRRPFRYTLRVRIAGRSVRTWHFRLRPAQTRTFSVLTHTAAIPSSAVVAAVLSRGRGTTPYRVVTLRPSAGSTPKRSG